MIDIPRYDFTLLAGDSFITDQFWFPENAPPDAQLWEIEAGIVEGVIRLRDWREFTIVADVKRNGEHWFSLTDHLKSSENGTSLWFEFTPEQTQKLGSGQGNYDVQISQNGQTLTAFCGEITVQADALPTPCP